VSFEVISFDSSYSYYHHHLIIISGGGGGISILFV